MLLEFIGEARGLSGNVAMVNVLGNHLPKNHKGYRPCLKIHFKDTDTAWKWHCKAFKLTVALENLKDSDSEGFKEVLQDQCVISELTDVQVQEEIQKHKETYPE